MRYREIVRKWQNTSTGALTMLPDWGGDDLKLGTVRGAVKQLGFTWEEFNRA